MNSDAKPAVTKPPLRRLCVFCGASPGTQAGYLLGAHEFGYRIAAAGLGLVYGGGRTGLMGAVSRGCREGGGEVIGVIPQALCERELADTEVDQLIVVDSMHTRKKTMADYADGFVALPGGIGTLEELFEILTWSQLGFHRKPIGLWNYLGFYDPLLGLLDHIQAQGFLRGDDLQRLQCDDDAARLIQSLTARMPNSPSVEAGDLR